MEKRAMGNLVKPVLNILSAVGAALKKARIRAVRAFDSSATAFYLKKLRESIPYLKNSVIGAFLLTFGIYSSLIAVFKLTFASGGSIEDGAEMSLSDLGAMLETIDDGSASTIEKTIYNKGFLNMLDDDSSVGYYEKIENSFIEKDNTNHLER